MHAPGACNAWPAVVSACSLLPDSGTVVGKDEVSSAGRQDAARVGARGAAAAGLLSRVRAGEVMQRGALCWEQRRASARPSLPCPRLVVHEHTLVQSATCSMLCAAWWVICEAMSVLHYFQDG